MEKRKTIILPFSTSEVNKYNAESERDRNIIGQRIEAARQERGLNLRDLSSLLTSYGVPVGHTAINKWTKGLTTPNAYQLLALCMALEIDDGLAFFTEDYTPELNKAGRSKLKAYKEDLIASGRYAPAPKISNTIKYIDMPVSNLRVSAGTGQFLDEDSFEMVSFPEGTIPNGADFGIRVSGNSMEPVYHDGQIVWVQKCDTISVGQVGIFVYDGEGYLKMYGEQDPEEQHRDSFINGYGVLRAQPVLLSYNAEYAPKVVNPEHTFQIVGKVL